MMTLGGMELLILMFMSPTAGADFIGLMDIDTYFKSRNLPMTIEKKIELAGTEPKTGAGQTRQLLSLRWFFENADKVNKSNKKAEILKLLQQIASGKKANDDLGFAKEYANIALLRLQGKKIPQSPPPENSVRGEALKWFPGSANLIGAMDVRGAAHPASAPKIFDNPLFAQMPADFKKKMFEQLFDAADEIGNIRINRVSFAYAEDLQNNDQSQIYIRITGKVDHQRYVDWMKNIGQGMVQGQTIKDRNGTPISSLQFGNNAPAFALVGETDMIIAGMQRNQGNHRQAVEEALAVRSGRQGNVTTGPMKKHLTDISKNASGMLIGNMPMTMRRMFGQDTPMPYFVTMQMERKGNDQLLSFHGLMSDALAAKNFQKTVLDGRDEILQKIQNPPPGFPVQMLQDVRKMLKSLKIEAKNSSVSGSMQFNPKMLMSIPYLTMAGARAPGIQLPLVFIMRRVR